MMQLNKRSPYRKYVGIASIALVVIALAVGGFMLYRYITSDPMGETTYKRSGPTTRMYEPTPEPSTTPKAKKTASPSPKPTHTPVLNQSPTRTKKLPSPSPAPTPSTSPTPTPVVVSPEPQPTTEP